ncbi:MAG: ankyrin repeat domain-containing protein [Bacteriovoracaceae bacterium]
MKLIWQHISSFALSNWILLSMVTIVSVLIVGVYSLGNLTYVSLMIPFFIYYTQAQVLQKQQSIKYKLSLPETRSLNLLLIGLEFLVLSLPQIITLQIFYHTIPAHSLLNPNRYYFLIYSIGGFWIYSLYLTGQWINQSRREIIINKWEVFISNIYTLISSIFKISLVVLYFRILDNFVKTYELPDWSSKFLMVLSFIIFSVFIHWENIKISMKEELSVFYWKRQGVILGLIFFLVLGSVFTYYQITEKKILFSNKTYNFIQEKKWKQAKELIDQTEDLNAVMEKGWNLQSILILYGNVELLEFAQQKGLVFNPNFIVEYPKDKYFHKMDSFLLSVESGVQEMIKYIARKTKDINRTHEVDLYNALHLSAFKCSLESMETLIGLGVNQNHQDNNGKTPLMVAYDRNCEMGVLFLISQKPNIEVKDNNGKTFKEYVVKDKNIGYLIRKNYAR